MTRSFRLKGWHVLTMLLSFFFLILTANLIFVTVAVRSFPGEQEKKSYLMGVAFNDRLDARAAQAALGWRAEIEAAALIEGRAAIDIAFSAAAAPVSGLALTGVLARPADDEEDHELTFIELRPGLYRTSVDDVAPGAWKFVATAIGPDDEVFELEKRLILE